MGAGTRALEHAIELDPKFASAYAELAGHFNHLAVLGMSPPAKVVPRARELARQALALDPSQPDAQAYLGIVAAMWDFDWNEGRRRFESIMAEAKIAPAVRLYCAVYLLVIGRPLDAAGQLQQAVLEDPLFPLYRMWWGIALWAGGRAEDGVKEFRLLAREGFQGGHGQLMLYHATRGEWADSLEHARQSYAAAPLFPHVRGALAAPIGAPLRSSAQWPALSRRLNLPKER